MIDPTTNHQLIKPLSKALLLIKNGRYEEAKSILVSALSIYANTSLETQIKYNIRICDRRLISGASTFTAQMASEATYQNSSGEKVVVASHVIQKKRKWINPFPRLLVISSSNDPPLVRHILDAVAYRSPRASKISKNNSNQFTNRSGKVVDLNYHLDWAAIVLSSRNITLDSQHVKNVHITYEVTGNEIIVGILSSSIPASLPKPSLVLGVTQSLDERRSKDTEEKIYLFIAQLVGYIRVAMSQYCLPLDSQESNESSARKCGILVSSKRDGGLQRDAIIVSTLLNSLGTIPAAYVYHDWRLLEYPLHDESYFDLPPSFPTQVEQFKRFSEFIDHLDILFVPELLLPKLYTYLLRRGKFIVLIPNIESTIEPESSCQHISYTHLRALCNNSNFTLLTKNLFTHRYYMSIGINAYYAPFLSDRELKVNSGGSTKHGRSSFIPSSTQKITKFFCNAGNTGVDDRKNLSTVLNAFHEATTFRDNIHLVIKSSIDLHERYPILSKLTGMVTIINAFVDDDSLDKLYLTCDCVIYVSKYDGMGLTVLEAKALGKPIIVSDIPLFREALYAYPKAIFCPGSYNGEWREVPVFYADQQRLAQIIADFRESDYSSIDLRKCSSYDLLRKTLFTRAIADIVKHGSLTRATENPVTSASIAHFAERESIFLDVLPSILKQIDRVNIGLNDFHAVHGWYLVLMNCHNINVHRIDRDMKALTKFLVSEADFGSSLYYFTLDDDIVLNDGYVKNRIDQMDSLGIYGVISSCGKRFNDFPVNRDDVEYNYRFRENRDSRIVVDNVGTGLMSWKSGSFSPNNFVHYLIENEFLEYSLVSVDDALTSYIFVTGLPAILSDVREDQFVLHPDLKAGLHEYKKKRPGLDAGITKAMLQHRFLFIRSKCFGKV